MSKKTFTTKVHHRASQVRIVSPRTGNTISVSDKDYTMITGYIFKPQPFPSTARLTVKEMQDLYRASENPTDWDKVEKEKSQKVYISFNGKKVLWEV